MNSEYIKAHLDVYLQKLARQEVHIPDDLIEEMCEALKVNFTTIKERSNNGEFTLRMSNIGRPLCQIQMEAQGAPQEAPHKENQTPVRFATGDMLEAWFVAVLKACGLPNIQVNIPTSVKIDGRNLKGSADIIIDGILYDIKTASDYTFRHKWSRGFQEVYDDDPFGYVVQGFCYAEGLGVPFGGWIVVNKNSGEIVICETPSNRDQLQKEALKVAASNAKSIRTNQPFERKFQEEEETFKKKATGNKKLPFTCSWCDYKGTCWPNIEYAPQVFSKAKDPKWEYYTEINNRPESEDV